ncbi:hypothetical protein [Helicobacter didelphidarum]|uniref:hypothetical protein n=1 Tax=Helicobacter didelphidarum TaxID=2040648 RepID=UPI0011C01890|nr:hypothetical protein [Helicobacter didelphidarum]
MGISIKLYRMFFVHIQAPCTAYEKEFYVQKGLKNLTQMHDMLQMKLKILPSYNTSMTTSRKQNPLNTKSMLKSHPKSIQPQ